MVLKFRKKEYDMQKIQKIAPNAILLHNVYLLHYLLNDLKGKILN